MTQVSQSTVFASYNKPIWIGYWGFHQPIHKLRRAHGPDPPMSQMYLLFIGLEIFYHTWAIKIFTQKGLTVNLKREPPSVLHCKHSQCCLYALGPLYMNPSVAVFCVAVETGGLHKSNKSLPKSSLINIMELKAIALYIHSWEIINIPQVYEGDWPQSI